jgi:histidinol phosphatase-like enzyme
METWNRVDTLKVRVTNPAEFERCVIIDADGLTNSGSLRLTQAEALQLRDDLSRAITKAATAAAKAVEVTP